MTSKLDEIAARRKGSKVDKAQNYDGDVDFLLGEVRRLTNDLRLAQSDKERLKQLERLEMAIQAVGYSRGPTAS